MACESLPPVSIGLKMRAFEGVQCGTHALWLGVSSHMHMQGVFSDCTQEAYSCFVDELYALKRTVAEHPYLKCIDTFLYFSRKFWIVTRYALHPVVFD